MDYNSYDILGIPYSSSREQIEERYLQLREQYRKDRFLVGLAGEEAAEKLQQLEVAYADIMTQFRSKTAEESSTDDTSYQDDFASPFELAQQYIKDNKLDEAQQELDNITLRNAEWHYLQSVVFYKRNWFLESKKQLEFACNLEPDNTKYRESLDKLNKILASNTISPDQLRTESRNTGGPTIGAGNGTCTGSSCGDCLMCNMCCNCAQCMGGC